MRILLDVSTLNPQKVTGVGVYMQQLLQHLPVVSPDVELVPVVKVSRFRKLKKIQNFIGKKCRILFPWKIFSTEKTLYHGPDFKLNTRGNLPLVATVHDMVVFEQKYNHEDFYEKGIADLSAVLLSPHLSAVIVNTEFTKKEVLKYFPNLQGKVYVTYFGCNRVASADLTQKKLDLPENYFLFLGTLEKRKNVLGVIKAFEIYKKSDGPGHLVFAGAWGFGADDIKAALAKSEYKDFIQRLDYVPNEMLPELYARAQAFVFPSFYEGFGLPVLEAMQLGCPVVTSDHGALAEVSGDAAILVDCQSPEKIAEGLHQVLDKNLREQLKAQGYKQAQKFTWEECAKKTYEVYRQVVRNV